MSIYQRVGWVILLGLCFLFVYLPLSLIILFIVLPAQLIYYRIRTYEQDPKHIICPRCQILYDRDIEKCPNCGQFL